MQQLHIIDKFDPEKILMNDAVRVEADRMARVSLNSNPCEWMDNAKVGLRVCSLNCRSLRKHVEDVRTDPVLRQADVIAPKASAEGACIFSKLVTMERV